MTDLLYLLRTERDALAKKLAGIDRAIAALNGHGAPVAVKKRTWKMSAAARAKISAAQKKRWAKVRK